MDQADVGGCGGMRAAGKRGKRSIRETWTRQMSGKEVNTASIYWNVETQ